MAVPPPTGPGKLPPPPAPPARDANPWKFSETARSAPPHEPTLYERLVAEIEQARAAQEAGAAGGPGMPPAADRPTERAGNDVGPASRPPKRESTFNRIFPVVILVIMFGSFARELIEERGIGDPQLVPLFALLMVAVVAVVLVALRRSRRRRRPG